MARYGYLLNEAKDTTMDAMEAMGCCRIFRESRFDTMTRPQRKNLLCQIGDNDEIVVPRLCHVVNGCSQLGVFLEYCDMRNIRLISVEDRIDTAGILYDGESDRNMVSAFKTLASDIVAIKKDYGEVPLQMPSSLKTTRREKKIQRDTQVIRMYLTGLNINDVLRLNSIGKSTLFRILRKHGIPTDRVGKQPICG